MVFFVCSFVVFGCDKIELVGICNDETNTAVCNYDGGDCCLNGDKNFCSEFTCYFQEICAPGFHP